MGLENLLVGIVWLALILLPLAGMWKVFEKAGEAGWACIIPIYNLVVLHRVAGRPGWWLILYFIPLVSLLPAFLVPLDIARNFDKGSGFGLGLVFLPFIFYPLLGFSDAEYNPDAEDE